MSAQSSLDSLIFYVNKNDHHKIIYFAEESKKQLDEYGFNKNGETYLTIDGFLAKSLIALQKYKEGEDVLLKVIDSRKKNSSHLTKEQALSLRMLANLYDTQFNFKKSEAIYLKIDSIAEKINLKETSFYANTLRIRAHSFVKQDSLIVAEKYLKK